MGPRSRILRGVGYGSGVMGEDEPEKAWRRFDPRHLSPPLRFVLLMGLYLTLFQAAFVQLATPLEGPLESLCRRTAEVVRAALAGLGAPTSLHQNVIALDGFSVRIILECTGVFEMVIFAACVLAYPASVRAKALGIGFGFLSIYVFNLLRIAGLLAVGRYANDYFDFFHIYFWQITLVGIIVANWLLWLNLVVRLETQR